MSAHYGVLADAVGAHAHEVGDVMRVGVDVVQRARIEVKKRGAPGQPTLAEAGGKNPAGLRAALEAGKQAIAAALK